FSFFNYVIGTDVFGEFLQIGCGVAPSLGSAACANNQVWGKGVASGRFASALDGGFSVRPNRAYFQQQARGARVLLEEIYAKNSSGTSRTYGQWRGASSRYLGLKFLIGGQLHYGWARVGTTPKSMLF